MVKCDLNIEQNESIWMTLKYIMVSITRDIAFSEVKNKSLEQLMRKTHYISKVDVLINLWYMYNQCGYFPVRWSTPAVAKVTDKYKSIYDIW